ncbi:MAG: SDR family NAD(P)-dependent oxidoreductase, partial [Rhodobacteraceae bacterium]|nr:SDR family NAD(P)-dependent oxidoreductase [Paracoccaceae bacterium]
MRFKGKTVLITGAAGGFGTGLAEAFAAEGANLVLGDLDAGPLNALGALIDMPNVTMVGDVCDPVYADALVDLAHDRF